MIYIGLQVLSHMLGGEPEVDEEGNAIRHDETAYSDGCSESLVLVVSSI